MRSACIYNTNSTVSYRNSLFISYIMEIFGSGYCALVRTMEPASNDKVKLCWSMGMM